MAKTNEAASTKVVTGEVRFSYAHVFEPASIEGSEPKYSVSILIDKNDKKTLSRVEAAIEAAKQAGLSKFGGKIPANLKLPLRDGDTEREDDEVYAGKYFINANAKTKPGILDKGGNPIIDTTEFYSGCYGHASVTFYAFNTSGNKGIACGLNNLMKTRDGEMLGGRASAEDDFADLIDEDFGDDDGNDEDIFG